MDIILLRNWINRFLYIRVLKPVLFLFDPELMHRVFLRMGKILNSNLFFRKIISIIFGYDNKILEQNLLGIKFSNPVGLAAGFDKNAEISELMGYMGFGFAEAGSITAKSCIGNSGKRMKRIIDKKSIWVNLGLNNKGADAILRNLKGRRTEIPFGINIAKTNSKETTSLEGGIEDYLYSLKKLKGVGSYFVLNISCPNAFGGQPFSNPNYFSSLIKRVERLGVKEPIFVKLSPDLSRKNVDSIIRISEKHGIKGFIISNLVKSNGKSGGYSGKIVEKKSNELLKYVYLKTRGKFVLIGAGGIFCAEDAYKKIKMGANLVQLFTGMIYQGPGLIGEINYELAKILKKEGYKNISEAVGSATKHI